MKNLIAFLVFGLLSGPMFSLDHNKPPMSSSLQVYAESGLNLRNTPELDSRIITVVPYGSSVTVVETTPEIEVIEWMSGSWVLVEYEGEQGYLFGGFLSDLPIPKESFEMSNSDMDLLYPFTNWMDHNYDQVRTADTLLLDHEEYLTKYYERGQWLSQTGHNNKLRVSAELTDTSLSEAYHLMKSLLKTDAEKITYDNKSIFIKDKTGKVNKIRVALENPVQLEQMEDGSTLIIITTYFQGCDVH